MLLPGLWHPFPGLRQVLPPVLLRFLPASLLFPVLPGLLPPEVLPPALPQARLHLLPETQQVLLPVPPPALPQARLHLQLNRLSGLLPERSLLQLM